MEIHNQNQLLDTIDQLFRAVIMYLNSVVVVIVIAVVALQS